MSNSPEIFEGLNVLDMTTSFAGALATMVMADNGAAVTRLVPAHLQDRDATAGLVASRQWHRGKQLVQTDIQADPGSAMCRDLVRSADVLVESYGQRILQASGLDFESVRLANPDLIYCSIDAFGDDPRFSGLPCHEGLVHAAGGRMVDFGRTFGFDRPAYSSSPVAGFGASQAVLHGVCASLHERYTVGAGGRRIRTSMLRCLTPFDLFSWANIQGAGGSPVRASDLPSLPYAVARASDGVWIQFASLAPHLFWRQAELLGLGHLRDDPRFSGMPQSFAPEAGHQFWEAMLEATAQRSSSEWMSIFTTQGGLGADLIRHTKRGMQHPQAVFNGNVVTSEEEGGLIHELGPIADMSATPSNIQHAARPWSARTREADRVGGARLRPRPLEGVTVIEAAAYVAAPLAPVLLADLGARVIKVEPLDGDPLRGPLSLKLTQGKESVAVDLKTEEGARLVHRLVAVADIFMHNYRPGVPERLQLDYETLRSVNPRIIYLSANGYGTHGPFADMPAFHPIAGAICGNAALQVGMGVLEDTGPITLEALKSASLRLYQANEGHPDMASGCAYASAILLALVARDRYGMGQEISATMLGANAYLMSDDWIDFEGCPERRKVDSQLLGTSPLNCLYRAKDGWVFLSAQTEHDCRALVTVIPELAERTRGELMAPDNEGLVDGIIGRFIVSRQVADLESQALGLGLGLVRADGGGFAEVLQSEFRGYAPNQDYGEITQRTDDHRLPEGWRHQSIVDMGTSYEMPKPSSDIGEHTASIMAELGYDEEEISRVERTGAVRTTVKPVKL